MPARLLPAPASLGTGRAGSRSDAGRRGSAHLAMALSRGERRTVAAGRASALSVVCRARPPGRYVDRLSTAETHDVHSALAVGLEGAQLVVAGAVGAAGQEPLPVGRPTRLEEHPARGRVAEHAQAAAVGMHNEYSSGVRPGTVLGPDVERDPAAVRGPVRVLEPKRGRHHLTQTGAVGVDHVHGLDTVRVIDDASE